MYTLPEQTKLTYKPYAGVSELKTIGGIAKTNKIISHAEMMEKIEEAFMNIAFKSDRSEEQRNERRNKRK